jgi:DNA-binding FrmR family transcriptional regulator
MSCVDGIFTAPFTWLVAYSSASRTSIISLRIITPISYTLYPHWVYTVNMIIEIKRRASHRIKIIQGQAKGLEKMIENEEYCMDILIQNLAIQKSLASLNKLILESHLRTHVGEMLSSDDEALKEKAYDELLTLYELHSIRGK